MSLNVMTVELDLEKHKFLGISIVGQNNESGDGGIYIGSIMKGGAVAATHRRELARLKSLLARLQDPSRWGPVQTGSCDQTSV